MPKQVDHDERRREIAAAVVRLAAARGLGGVSFREVAAEAGVSVALVQHYFGTKENLLIGTLDIESARLNDVISDRLAQLAPDASALDQLRAIAGSFLATNPDSRDAMLLYHGFGAVALTDPALRRAEAFRNADNLVGAIGLLLGDAQAAGLVVADVDVTVEAWGVLALVLGLSFGVLLEQLPGVQAEAALDAHLDRLAPPGQSARRSSASKTTKRGSAARAQATSRPAR
jgi:AcrR family transcriptional regulator